MQLIDEARERVLITCQYFPNDVTAAHLQAAYERGVKVEIYITIRAITGGRTTCYITR